jgi:hypothetical protein
MKPIARVQVGNHWSVMFPVKNDLKHETLSPLLFNFALENAIRRIHVYQDGMKLKGTHQRLVYADDINTYGAEAYILHGDQKVSVHLLTPIHLVTSNVQCSPPVSRH